MPDSITDLLTNPVTQDRATSAAVSLLNVYRTRAVHQGRYASDLALISGDFSGSEALQGLLRLATFFLNGFAQAAEVDPAELLEAMT